MRILFSVMMLGLVACGSDGLSPVEQCNLVVDDLCTRGVECFDADHAKCVAFIQQTMLSCKSIKTTDAMTYDGCVEKVNTAECKVLFPIEATGGPPIQVPMECEYTFDR